MIITIHELSIMVQIMIPSMFTSTWTVIFESPGMFIEKKLLFFYHANNKNRKLKNISVKYL